MQGELLADDCNDGNLSSICSHQRWESWVALRHGTHLHLCVLDVWSVGDKGDTSACLVQAECSSLWAWPNLLIHHPELTSVLFPYSFCSNPLSILLIVNCWTGFNEMKRLSSLDRQADAPILMQMGKWFGLKAMTHMPLPPSPCKMLRRLNNSTFLSQCMVAWGEKLLFLYVH